MTADPGPFEAFYASFWQHPVLLWGAALGAYAYVRSRSGLSSSLRRTLAALTALSLLDAWLTANHVVGIGALPAALAGVVPLTFVLLGDFRFFLLVMAGTPDGRVVLQPRAIAIAAALTVLVPLATQAAMALLPEDLRSPRTMFWIYETAFVVLTAAGIRRLPRVRANPWLRSVSGFVIVYYGAWVAADSILLATGSDLGFALRVVPNVLYYGGLIAAIAATAPRSGEGARESVPQRAPGR